MVIIRGHNLITPSTQDTHMQGRVMIRGHNLISPQPRTCTADGHSVGMLMVNVS